MSEPLQEPAYARSTTGPSQDEWAGHKETIRTLYIEQKKVLKEVVSIMSDYYGFEATPRMFKKRLAEWKFRKYTSGTVYADCAAKLKDYDGKSHIPPHAKFGISPVPLKRVKRYMKRKAIADRQRPDFYKRKVRGSAAGQLERSSSLRRSSSNIFRTPFGQSPDLDYSTASSTDSIGSLSPTSTYLTDNSSLYGATNGEAVANGDSHPFASIEGRGLWGSIEDQTFMSMIEFVRPSWEYMSIGGNLAGPPLPDNPDLQWIESFAYISGGAHGQSDGFDTNMLTLTRPISPETAYGNDVSQINHEGEIDVDIVKPREMDLARCCSEQINDTMRWIKICILVARFEAFGMPDQASMGKQMLSQLFKQMAANQDRNMLPAILCVAVALFSHDLKRSSTLLNHACKICKSVFGAGHPITVNVEFIVGLAAEEMKETSLSPSHLERMTRELCDKFGPAHPSSMVSLYNLAVAFEMNKHPNEAINTLRHLEMSCAQQLPRNHPLGIMCRMTLARLLADQSALQEAVSFMTLAIDQCRYTWRVTNPYTLECIRRLTNLYKKQGKSHKVEYGFNYVFQGRKISLGQKHRLTIGSYDEWKNSLYGPESLRMQMCY